LYRYTLATNAATAAEEEKEGEGNRSGNGGGDGKQQLVDPTTAALCRALGAIDRREGGAGDPGAVNPESAAALEAYAQWAERDGTFGERVEVQAAADVLGRAIHIHCLVPAGPQGTAKQHAAAAGGDGGGGVDAGEGDRGRERLVNIEVEVFEPTGVKRSAGLKGGVHIRHEPSEYRYVALVLNAPNIQNMLNQAPLGFTCSTKRFKQDNCIPQSTAVPEYMTSSQLGLRKMAQRALMADIKRDDMNSCQAERRMREIRDKTMAFAEFMQEGGLRMMPGGGSFGSAAVAIEAKHHKMTRRQLKIERKEIASQQINREDGATALENIQTGTIGLSTQ
jgi:hypothetical protein